MRKQIAILIFLALLASFASGCAAVHYAKPSAPEETAATARVRAEGESAEKCAVCGKEAESVIIFARAY